MWIETTALRHPPSLRFGAAGPSQGRCRAIARRAKAGRLKFAPIASARQANNAPFVYQLGFDVFTVEKPGQHRQGVPFWVRKQKLAGSFSGQDVAF
jgi:hypothetical protein